MGSCASVGRPEVVAVSGNHAHSTPSATPAYGSEASVGAPAAEMGNGSNMEQASDAPIAAPFPACGAALQLKLQARPSARASAAARSRVCTGFFRISRIPAALARSFMIGPI